MWEIYCSEVKVSFQIKSEVEYQMQKRNNFNVLKFLKISLGTEIVSVFSFFSREMGYNRYSYGIRDRCSQCVLFLLKQQLIYKKKYSYVVYQS